MAKDTTRRRLRIAILVLSILVVAVYIMLLKADTVTRVIVNLTNPPPEGMGAGTSP